MAARRRLARVGRSLALRSLVCSAAVGRSAGAHVLVTFDVDGTLVRSGVAAEASAHARAFAAATGKVLGDGSPTKLPSEVLEGHEFHGSTDGLILLNLARKALGISPGVAKDRLGELWRAMYDDVAALTDAEMAKGIEPLPGVIETLTRLSRLRAAGAPISCGLVTGNVEGIARKKMRAVGVKATGALSPAAPTQACRDHAEITRRSRGDRIEVVPRLRASPTQTWDGENADAFLGGFGSDFCSGDIDDPDRRHLDRAELIAIAAKRCQSCLPRGETLQKVVHVGDAPGDVLGARALAECGLLLPRAGESTADAAPPTRVAVGLVAVATGRYDADELRKLAGPPVAGTWEPIVLDQGMADPRAFLDSVGIR